MINRRHLLQTSAALSLTSFFSKPVYCAPAFNPTPDEWHGYEVRTHIAVPDSKGITRAWVPLPSVSEADWIRPLGNDWSSNASRSEIVRDPIYGTQMLSLEWAADETNPFADVVSRFVTRSRAADLSKVGTTAADLSPEERALNLAATHRIPVDGIVLETAQKIVSDRTTEIDKVRAIYEWVVENTYRDAATRGCGEGDIIGFLQSGKLGGKCADINPLFVALNRAVGIPARDLYGIRVAPSAFGYKSLGPQKEIISGAQHCRAEVFLSGFGWAAMDPADVRKVMLEEVPQGLGFDDERVIAARKTLFGSWEGNWLPYNAGHDLALPGSAHAPIAFLMYPQVETAGMHLDCLDAKAGGYAITTKPIEI